MQACSDIAEAIPWHAKSCTDPNCGDPAHGAKSRHVTNVGSVGFLTVWPAWRCCQRPPPLRSHRLTVPASHALPSRRVSYCATTVTHTTAYSGHHVYSDYYLLPQEDELDSYSGYYLLPQEDELDMEKTNAWISRLLRVATAVTAVSL